MDGLRGDLRVAFEVARHTARWAALFLVLAKQAETIFVGGALMFKSATISPITGPWASPPPSQLEVHYS